jgi:hypothetical protein
MHFPPWQLVEQQSPGSAQASPSVLQAAPATAAQEPPEQRPEQQSAGALQDEAAVVPVGLHTVPAQRPLTQESEQHSPGSAQAAPGVLQKAVEVQVWVVGLQAVEQQPALPVRVQSVPEAWQAETGAAQRCVIGLQ